MIVLAKEIMIETLLEEILTETGTTEDEGEVAVTAGVGVEVGVKRGFVTETGIEAGLEAGAGHEAGVNNHIWVCFAWNFYCEKNFAFEGFKNCFVSIFIFSILLYFICLSNYLKISFEAFILCKLQPQCPTAYASE